MHIDIKNLFLTLDIKASRLKDKEVLIKDQLESFFKRNQGFLNLPKVMGNVLAVKDLAEKYMNFKDVVVIGIGGSSLGVSAIMESILGVHHNNKSGKRLFVLDNLDLTKEVEELLDLDKTLFVIISKSGNTLETIEQFKYFEKKVPKGNFIFITNSKVGFLREYGRKYKIPMLDIPENVGGRFSVLSAVGLFPAALMGVQIEEMLAGAEEMADLFKSEEFDLNPAFQLATVQYILDWEFGISINVLMPYSSRLQFFAKWYSQLLAESIGKNGKGITPVCALGVSDQHSQIQLYNEGPRDKLVIFMEVEKSNSEGSVDEFEKLMKIEKDATEFALTEYKKPNITIKIPKLDERNLGKLFMLFETSIAFLGEYYRINAFDQPGVELAKKIINERFNRNTN